MCSDEEPYPAIDEKIADAIEHLEVTDAMVERGAIALWQTYKRERPSASTATRAIQQGRKASGWGEVAIKDWYRRKARAVLEGALKP